MGDKRTRQKTAIVVGAGAGGIAAAARLAKAGFKVTVVEKNDFTGGRCSLIHHDGYRFDQGPSLLLIPHLFHETFRDLDTSLDAEGVHLRKCDPNYNIFFADGERMELSTDLARMKTEIERWEGKDGFERYLQFLQESHRHYELSITHVLRKNFTSLFSLLRPASLICFLRLHVFTSIYNRTSRYFRSERLRQVFTFASMYMGTSPFEAPGTYSLLQYTELAEGIWYPEGGFHRVLGALVEVGKRYGVTYRLSAPIQRIILSPDNRRATGVLLQSGESLIADIVICNADLVYAYSSLLPSTSYSHSLSKRHTSCSSVSLYWSLSKTVPELGAHNIFLPEGDYKASFDATFNDLAIAEHPTFYVHVSSRVDSSAAPEGRDGVVVLFLIGNLGGGGRGAGSLSATHDEDGDSGDKEPVVGEIRDWDKTLAAVRKTVIDTIKTRAGVDLAPLITHEEVNTPHTWRSKFNLDRGAILGLSHNLFNVVSFRPKTKHPTLEGLYFVGASTHPGTGVPVCLAGAKIVCEQILEAERMGFPWAPGGVVEKRRAKGKAGELDEVSARPVLSWVHVVLLVLVLAVLVWTV